jgi:glucoamylase
MPLAWAHAEYIKLCRSLSAKKVFDMPYQTWERYLIDKTEPAVFIWNFANAYKYIPKGQLLRIQCMTPATVRWSRDNWMGSVDVPTLDSGLGVHYADLPTRDLEAGREVNYTFYWHDSETWDTKTYSLLVGENLSVQA